MARRVLRGGHNATFRDRERETRAGTVKRLNGEIKRRTDVVAIFPNDDAIVRLFGALLLEQNDEWAVRRTGWMKLETIAPIGNDPVLSFPTPAS